MLDFWPAVPKIKERTFLAHDRLYLSFLPTVSLLSAPTIWLGKPQFLVNLLE